MKQIIIILGILLGFYGIYFVYTKFNNVTVSSVQLNSTSIDTTAKDLTSPVSNPGAKDVELQRELNQ